MKKALILLFATALMPVKAFSQITLNTTYVNDAKFHNKGNTAEGNANISLTKAAANISLSKQVSPDYKSIRTWNYFITGSYLNVNTTNGYNFPTDRIVNIYTGLAHYRTLSSRWGLICYGGIGITQDDSRFSEFRSSDIMGFAIATAVYKVNRNFQIGGGLIFTNVYKDLLVIPTLYVKWENKNKYFVDIQTRTFDFNGEAGVNLNNCVALSLHSEYNRIGTSVDKENEKDQYFNYNYLNSGLKANFNISKHLSTSVEAGVSAAGNATYKKRALKYIFKESLESYSMKAAPYCSI